MIHPLSIAIVGFGRMAQTFYTPGLKRLAPEARYIIVDPVDEARGKAKEILPTAACLAAVEELADQAMDAALIVSPPAAHFAAWRMLTARNVPIFMEKPFPLPNDIGAVEEMARGASPLFMINFNRRFWAPYQRLLAVTRSGGIGPMEGASLELITDPAKWNRSRDGGSLTGSDGALQDLGCHLVDFALRLFGSSPAAIVAVPSNAADFAGLSFSLQWSDGRAVDARVGYGKNVETISVTGSEGTLTMYQAHGRLWRGQRSRPATGRLRRTVADLMTVSSYALRPAQTLTRATTLVALGSFLGCLRTGAVSTPNLADALRVARILAAAEQSLASGRLVRLAA